MASGDSVTAWASKALDATTDVHPGVGAEWLIHTLVSESGKQMEVYRTADGATFTLIDICDGGSIHGLMYRVTNSDWLQLKNTSGGTAFNGYMGTVWK